MSQFVQSHISNSAIPMAAKILIVDDEPDIVEEVVEQLEDEGLECVSAGNSADAMNLVQTDKNIGIIITDIRMPGMDGLEMARRLNEEYRDSRDLFIIVVTGHAGMKEAIEALQLGAEDFLTKPISPDHLLHSVRRASEMIHLRTNERHHHDHLEREVMERTAEARQLAADLAERNRELNRKNQELTVVNRIKGEFLQMMSHELNTPLNAILGFSQLLQEPSEKNTGEKVKKCADHIYSAGMRLTKTVNSILTLSSLSAGDFPLTYIQFTAHSFIDSVAAESTEILNEWGAKLDRAFPQPPFDMDGDYMLLQKAIGGLIENAAKYGPQGGSVSLTMIRDDDRVRIEVSDDGPGMTAEQVAIAMEPMRQVDGSSSRKFEGMGLGLPLAQGIAELHGGSLTIDSTPGNGTTVTLSVPAIKDADK